MFSREMIQLFGQINHVSRLSPSSFKYSPVSLCELFVLEVLMYKTPQRVAIWRQPLGSLPPSRAHKCLRLRRAQNNTLSHDCGRKKRLPNKFLFPLKHSQRSICSSPSQSEPSPPSQTRNSLSKRANDSDGRFARKQIPTPLRGEASDGVSFPDNEACLMSCLLSWKKKSWWSWQLGGVIVFHIDEANQRVHRKTLWNPPLPLLLFAHQRFKTFCASPAKFPDIPSTLQAH